MSTSHTGNPDAPEGQIGGLIIIVRRGTPAPCHATNHHLTFGDPPSGVTPERYEALVRQAARDAGGEETFTIMMLRALGTELVHSHGVAADVAEREVTEFAKQVYAEEAQ